MSHNTSFGSGHSAAAWSVATVFAEEFGDDHKWVPYASYGLAALTSYARVHHNKHWASDAVLGAMVGFVAGKIFHKLYRKYAAAKIENVQFVPLLGATTGFKFIITSKVYNDLTTWPIDFMYLYQERPGY